MSRWIGAAAHFGSMDVHINLDNVVAIHYTSDRPAQDQEGRLVLYVSGGDPTVPLIYHGVTAERLYQAIEAEWLAGAL